MKFINKLKLIIPYALFLIFIFFIFKYYQSNREDFFFLKNINFKFIIIIIFLCFIYLIIESLILKKIVYFFNKHISNQKCFLVICSTYLFNTFVQLSGLGFRAYYLNKKKNIDYSKFLITSIFSIISEFFIFSSVSLISLIIIINFYGYSLNPKIIIILTSVLFLSIIGILFNRKIFFFFYTNFKLKKFKLFNYFSEFYNIYDEKKVLKFFFSLFSLYIFSYIVLFIIFLIGFNLLEKENLIISSILSTVFTDFSFLFVITPYGVGINEVFLFFGNLDFKLTLAEILFLSNLFRISMFSVYFLIGLTYTFVFFKNDNNN